MKIGTYRNVTREELKEAPGWITKLLQAINSATEKTYNALARRLNFQDNFNAEERLLSLTDQEEIDVKMQTISGKVTKAYVVWSGFYEFCRWKAKILDEQTVRISVTWDTIPPDPVDVLWRFEGN
jgi:hypothetical protein